AVRSIAVRCRPRVLAPDERRPVGKAFGDHHTFERGQPMVVVARAVIRLTTVGSSFERCGEFAGPLLPREVAFPRQCYGEREGLRLPWFGEYRAVVVPRQLQRNVNH